MSNTPIVYQPLCAKCGYRKKVNGFEVCSTCKASIKKKVSSELTQVATRAFRDKKQSTNIEFLNAAREKTLVVQARSLKQEETVILKARSKYISELADLLDVELPQSDKEEPKSASKVQEVQEPVEKPDKSPKSGKRSHEESPNLSEDDELSPRKKSRSPHASEGEGEELVTRADFENLAKMMDQQAAELEKERAEMRQERLAMMKLIKQFQDREKELGNQISALDKGMDDIEKALPPIDPVNFPANLLPPSKPVKPLAYKNPFLDNEDVDVDAD